MQIPRECFIVASDACDACIFGVAIHDVFDAVRSQAMRQPSYAPEGRQLECIERATVSRNVNGVHA
jgi:hypothetical protein